MDGYSYKKPEAGFSSSSSFTGDLFGFKEPPPSSSTGIFASIFSPPSAVHARKPPVPEVRGSKQKHQFGRPKWNTKQAARRNNESYNTPNNNMNPMFQEERVAHSIYVHLFTMAGKTTACRNHRLLRRPDHIPYSRWMSRRVTRVDMAPLEETGGKVLCIIRIRPSLGT